MSDELMTKQSEIVQRAKAIIRGKRRKILMSFKETELHKYLKELFKAMQPNYTIEITHGSDELGKDLVIVKKDNICVDVIGIVVKTGDIRGKTLGKVDEVKTQVEESFSYAPKQKIRNIESQVKQAFAHPAEMKTIFKELPVSKVIVVLAGEISNNARQRLNYEFKKGMNIEIRDIDWLIDNFTKYYPQVFFEGKVIDFLQEKILQLETKHWISKKRRKNLSNYFVDPLVATIEIPEKFDEKKLASIIKKQKIPFSRLKSILTQTRQIILVGDPGVGKSGALAKLTIDMLREATALVFKGVSKKKTIEMPILITAKEILETANSESLIEKFVISPEIRDRCRVNVIMIDALDEVMPDQREKVIEKGKKFSKQLKCSLVITSRKIDIVKIPLQGFKRYELLPFEYGQALKLFEKLVSNKKVLGSLKDGLEKMNFKIPMIPLSLMLLIELVEDNKEIPASVTELYDRYYELMLGRWDKEKGIEVLFEYFAKKSFLAELAFMEFLKKERLEIPKKEFEGFSNNYANKYGWDKEKLKDFIKEIERVGALDIGETVAFRHRSFLDYFAAVYIFNKQNEIENLSNFIAQIYFDDIWGDVTFFYIGLKREISDIIIEKIFAVEKNDLFTYINKLLLGRLLQAGWNSPTKTKYNGIEKVSRFAPMIRDKLVKILGENQVETPGIFTDFLVLNLSDITFGSTFLFKEVKSLFNDISVKPSKNSLYIMLSLLWAIKRFLNHSELRESINKFLETISKVPSLSVEEQARLLLFLMIIEQKDKTIVQNVKKKLDKLKRKYPNAFKGLLPHRKKGFR